MTAPATAIFAAIFAAICLSAWVSLVLWAVSAAKRIEGGE
jgi:hypothetical protein